MRKTSAALLTASLAIAGTVVATTLPAGAAWPRQPVRAERVSRRRTASQPG